MKAIVLGSSGLVGGHLLNQLINDSSFTQITIFVRKLLPIHNSKLIQIVFDFNTYSTTLNLDGDVVFCCLGTTIKKAGSKEAFRKVDFDAPLFFAKEAKKSNVKCFCLVSSMGASANSSIFYSKVKGELEDEIAKLSFPSSGMFRPSLLLGERSESRMGENLGKYLMLAFDFLIPAKYKAIEASKVAMSMIDFAKKAQTGHYVFLSNQIQKFQ